MGSNQRKLAILCVDDEETILKSLRRQLREICPHHQIELAQSSTTALKLLEKRVENGSPFALMIVDHLMPGMKGDELLKRATLLSPQTYQIMLTGQIDGPSMGQIVNHARLFYFLSKPWSIEELTVVVKNALTSYQKDQDLQLQQEKSQQLAHQLRQAQKMEILGHFSSEIAHDFNNLLSVVLLSSDSVRDHLDLLQNSLQGSVEDGSNHALPDQSQIHKVSPLFTDSFSLLDEITSACTHAGKLARKLLSLSRKNETEHDRFDAVECACQTMSLLHRLMPSHIQLNYLHPHHPLMAYGNESALQQVILNLVVNARDAVQSRIDQGQEEKKRGEIEVVLSLHQQDHDQECLVGQLQKGSYIYFKITDTGIGIKPNQLHHIFEPFFSSKGKEGTGLGLSIVYNTIINGFQGAINVKSIRESSLKTSFEVYIPCLTSSSESKSTY